MFPMLRQPEAQLHLLLALNQGVTDFKDAFSKSKKVLPSGQRKFGGNAFVCCFSPDCNNCDLKYNSSNSFDFEERNQRTLLNLGFSDCTEHHSGCNSFKI